MTSQDEAFDLLVGMELEPGAIRAMLPKMMHLNIVIEGIASIIANGIKQGMLSLGGNAVLAGDVDACNSAPRTDVILMGTLMQLQMFCDKNSLRPSGLSEIAGQISAVMKNVFLDHIPLRTARREIRIGERTLIMGILNVTPDSFSDGGKFMEPEKAVEDGVRMAMEGADILDIGGESTRPGSDPVSIDEEMGRVLPVIRDLSKKINIPLSVDTMKAEVAREALAAGAEIVNDVSAMNYDSQMAKVIADAGAAVILMHMRGTPKVMQTGDLAYRSLRGDIISFLEKRIENAIENGVDPERIIVDPGLGFGKTQTDNLRLIKYLREFKSLGRPIMIGASRKSFIGRITGEDSHERREGTAAAITVAITNGCNIIRVHDVSAMKKTAAVADAVIRA